MKKGFAIITATVVLAFLVMQVYSLVQIYFVKKGIKSVSYDLTSHSELSGENERKILEKQYEINEGIGKANKKIEDVAEKQDLYAGENEAKLSQIASAIDVQTKETKKTRRTYEAVLEEQKKKTVDVASKDDFIKQKKNEAAAFYVKKDYLNAYKTYEEILLYQEDDLDMRFLRMASLYKTNPQESRNFRKILEDCSILRSNGYRSTEMDSIENAIKGELGENE